MTLRVVSFNLRTPCDAPPNDWDSRRPRVAALLGRLRPDLLGTQEGMYSMVRAVAADRGLDWLGTGRDGGSRGEFMAVFWRDRFEPVAYDHFWLSDEPDRVGSSTWGNHNVRMVTWVELVERSSGRRLVQVNTHLDHAIAEAREKGAALLAERVAAVDAALPVIVTGDFNAAPGSPAHRILLESGLRDAWDEAPDRGEDGSSYHSFGTRRDGARIDWILLRGPVSAERAWIDREPEATGWPSDHYPMIADLRVD